MPSNASVSPERLALARVAELQQRRDFASLVRDMDAFLELEELQLSGCKAIRRIIFEGGSCEEATAAGAVECVVRALDLFQHSAEMQGSSLAALAISGRGGGEGGQRRCCCAQESGEGQGQGWR